jgi:hypothetical protein
VAKMEGKNPYTVSDSGHFRPLWHPQVPGITYPTLLAHLLLLLEPVNERRPEMVHMKLCPNCRTIQKAGTTCSICKCPIALPQPPNGPEKERKKP